MSEVEAVSLYNYVKLLLRIAKLLKNEWMNEWMNEWTNEWTNQVHELEVI
jgi:hypothetical protein